MLDLYIYGDVLAPVANHPNLEQIKGDLRDRALLEESLRGCDSVIHLACISTLLPSALMDDFELTDVTWLR